MKAYKELSDTIILMREQNHVAAKCRKQPDEKEYDTLIQRALYLEDAVEEGINRYLHSRLAEKVLDAYKAMLIVQPLKQKIPSY